ncbi:GNAT family N-acetyltransferase [Nocardioides speluncae]|uniref:GNAT family N-acetyltransferase n=1 Tax=Nocardioides speluncae TaxID=2670337 RepID=UPI001F0B7E20|nr:GNAT family N-acetyltransferase [Nocardioides speluncae]
MSERLRIERLPITHADAALLVEEVQQEYVVRYGGRDDTPLEPDTFELPRGTFVVAYDGDTPVATGAWRLRDDVLALGTKNAAEIKRMYVVPSARRGGVAAAVLEHLERTAREAGAEVTILETGTKQPEAIAFYQRCGYTEIENFGYYRDEPESVCFARLLGVDTP